MVSLAPPSPRRSGGRTLMSLALVGIAAAGAGVGVAAAATARPRNSRVPQPARAVDLNSYAGRWYEMARYENRFEKGCEAVTADYQPRPDGTIEVVNTCHVGAVDGRVRRSKGRAKVVADSRDAKLKVSFFWPFFGDYWVLDHGEDYAWSIVGEPSGAYLWILTREQAPSPALRADLLARAASMGYDPAAIRATAH
jgi:apolipoprotein D and lipocalin family protein